MLDGFRIVHIRFKRDKSCISWVWSHWTTTQFGRVWFNVPCAFPDHLETSVSGPSQDERVGRVFEDLRTSGHSRLITAEANFRLAEMSKHRCFVSGHGRLVPAEAHYRYVVEITNQ